MAGGRLNGRRRGIASNLRIATVQNFVQATRGNHAYPEIAPPEFRVVQLDICQVGVAPIFQWK